MSAKWFNYLRREPGPNEGINPAWWLFHRSLARTNKRHGYVLANEWIASSIGQVIRLPIPPFALMRKSPSTTRYFASLDYGKKEVAPSDMKSEPLCRLMPHEATGIVIFDAFIGNYDRHEGNVKVDSPDNPTAIEVIDHDCSLFGDVSNRGIERLHGIESRLGFTKLRGTTDVHKIAKELKTAEHFDHWLERIESIPDCLIGDLLNEAAEFGLTSEETEECKRFLRHRRSGLREIIRNNKSFFPIKNWGLFLQ